MNKSTTRGRILTQNFLWTNPQNNKRMNLYGTYEWTMKKDRRHDCRLPPFTKTFCQQSADCWLFVGTKPLTIPLHHPRSQEGKNLFTAASCRFFFCFTKSEHYQLIFIIGHWRLKTWWLLKELFFVTSETSFVKALVKFKRQQLPLKAHCAHKRHVTPEAFPAHLL